MVARFETVDMLPDCPGSYCPGLEEGVRSEVLLVGSALGMAVLLAIFKGPKLFPLRDVQ